METVQKVRVGIDLDKSILDKIQVQAEKSKRKRKAEIEKIIEDYFL
jgi:hypothetical protein